MKIMLDAGHGYYTPGKRSFDGMREFEFNIAVAILAKNLLLEYQDTQVIFSHDPTGKVDVPLAERVAKALKEKVDAVVSIHANAFGDGWNEAEGIETFISEDRMPFTELELASHIQNQLIRETGRKNRGVKRGNLYMTKVSNMIPSVLVEAGFMTNKEEATLLKSTSYREKVAQAIVNGLVLQFKLNPKQKAKPSTVKVYRLKSGPFPTKEQAEMKAEEIRKNHKITVHVVEE
jgi:N-acetylmuramoyl-L-alanine amidase